MGLLDDAIRDHLELKRRHGADPGEVARLEHEALGPARREPVAAVQEVDPPDDEVGYDDEVPADERLEAPVHYDEPESPAAAPRAHDADQPTERFSLEELEAASQAPPRAEPPAPRAPERAAGEPGAGERAAPERPADDHDVVPADDEPDAHDELEETPEFLQETPEHDRLWFEQKPPRDFDF